MRPRLVRVDEVAAVPWRNGGGVTRELLAWPDPGDWLLRVSVAEIGASGPFSTFPGVERWFAVLAGDGVRLETAGHTALELTPADDALHAFPGDAETRCTLLGSATRDLNFMARRGRARLRACPLRESPGLSTRSSGIGLFVAGPVTVTTDGTSTTEMPALSLAWWPNPEREPVTLRAASKAYARGWWFEVDA
jgi:environmental stress-induced protein Ves